MQGTVEWLKKRQKGIGGSDVAAILGFNKFSTPYDIYLEKIADEPILKEEHVKMKRGKQMENTIAEMFAEETGAKILNTPDMVWSETNPLMFASLDRIIWMEDHGRGILELKNTVSETIANWEDGIPDYYMTQVQHQLFVTGYEYCMFCYLVDGWDLKYVMIKPDHDYIKKQNELLEAFWNNHVAKRIAPDPISVDDLEKMFPKITEKEIEVTEELVKTLEKINDLKEKIDNLKEEKETLELSLKLVMLDNSIAKYKDTIVCTYKQTKPGSAFNEKEFKENNTDIYKKYVKETKPQRRFLSKIKVK